MTRYVGLGKESTYGTPVAATRYIDAVASLKPNHNWYIQPSVVDRSVRKKVLGIYRTEGRIGEFDVEPENIGELLLGCFGSVSTSQPQAGVYQHTFSPADTLPSYTLRLGSDIIERVLPGCLVEALTFKFTADKPVKATAEVYSGMAESLNSIGTPTLSTLPPLTMFENSTLTIAGSDKRQQVYEVEVTVKNNILFNRGAVDSRYYTVRRYGQREVTGKVSLYFDDTSELQRFLNGEEFALVVQAQGAVIAEGYRYGLKLELRRCVYLRDAAPDIVAASEPLVIEAPFQAFYDTTGGFNAEVKATLVNTVSTY